MDRSELIAYVKSESINNLVCAGSIQNWEEIERMKKQGYSIAFTANEWENNFPKLNPDFIYYNNGIHQTFYFDKENLILFPIELYGAEALKPYDELQNVVVERAEKIKGNVEKGDYASSLLVLGDRMRMEMLNLMIDEDRCNNLYELFTNFYQTSDYGCSAIKDHSMRKLMSLKSPKETEHTKEMLKDFPATVTVYRGEGDRSAAWQESMSWTTDINIANFFASRMTGHNAVIHIAEVDKMNIAEYFEYENECIILPENIRYLKSIELQGTDFIEDMLPKILNRYQLYRDMALDLLDFRIDDNEHGRLHTFRVLMNALMISEMKDLPESDKNILATAAIFHDTMRDNNGDDRDHGEKSAEYYAKFAASHSEYEEYCETVYQLIKYHCLPYEEGYRAIAKEKHHLFEVFKDADALDRVRFGMRNLDMNQLRTDEAKSLTMVACIMLQAIRIPEPQLESGMEMT